MTNSPHRRARFHFSAYWRSWSLLLTERCNAAPGYGPTVEITLATTSDNDGNDIRLLKVRRHCTDFGRNDTFADALPDYVEHYARELLGDECFEWLTSDASHILAKIDWTAMHCAKLANAGGGIPLAECIDPRFVDQMVRARIARDPGTDETLVPFAVVQ